MFRESTKARYTKLRNESRRLHNTIVRTLPKGALQEGGRELGILQSNTLVFENETEMGVLMDHCIYDLGHQGQTAIERYAASSKAPPGSDERILLNAMTQARYSLLRIAAEPIGIIVPMHDLFHDEPVEIADVGFSSCGRAQNMVGAAMAARYLTIEEEGFSMTTGAPLPLQADMIEELMNQLSNVIPPSAKCPLTLSRDGWTRFATTIIRTLLRLEASEYIRLQDVPSRGPGRISTARPTLPTAAPRNAPCPCGSGHKYKKCCGRMDSGLPSSPPTFNRGHVKSW